MQYHVFLGRYRVPSTKSPQWWETCRQHVGLSCEAEEIESGKTVLLELVPSLLLGKNQAQIFEKTAAAAEQIRHLNLPTLREVAIEDGQFVLVSEKVNGLNAKDWVAACGPAPVTTALGIVLQVVNALRVAARHDLHHQALHPGNLMIIPGEKFEGRWPLVKLLHLFAPSRSWQAFDASHPMVAAMAPFASPEQLTGAAVDFRSEVYSLGAILCFLLTGMSPSAPAGSARERRPFSACGSTSRLRDLPRPVSRLLGRLLSEDRSARPSDPVAFEKEIRACLVEMDSAKGRRPVAPISSGQSVARVKPRGLWPVARKVLSTAGAAAICAAAIGAVGSRALTHQPLAVASREKLPPSSPSPPAVMRAGLPREDDGAPAAMNFAVVAPSDQSDHQQIRSLREISRATLVPAPAAPEEAPPPAEGPDPSVIEMVGKARMGPGEQVPAPLVFGADQLAAPRRPPDRKKD